MPTGAQVRHRDRPPLQLPDRAHLLPAEEFETADVDPGQDHERLAAVQAQHIPRSVQHGEVDLAGGQGLAERPRRGVDVVQVRESLGPQQVFSHELRRQARGGAVEDPQGSGLGRRLRRARPGMKAEQSSRAGQGEPAQDAAPGPAVSVGGTHGRPPFSRRDHVRTRVGASVGGPEGCVNAHRRRASWCAREGSGSIGVMPHGCHGGRGPVGLTAIVNRSHPQRERPCPVSLGNPERDSSSPFLRVDGGRMLPRCIDAASRCVPDATS
jgi:hypothetical protein